MNWISVKDRLPELNYQCVLVYLGSDCYDIAVWHEEHGFRAWWMEEDYGSESCKAWESEVLAWMPLPMPYKKGD